MATTNLPKNAHVSTHPCLQAKLSQLRSASTGSRDAQTLVHEIALMVGYEALGSGLKSQQGSTVRPHFTLHSCAHTHLSIGILFPPKTLCKNQPCALSACSTSNGVICACINNMVTGQVALGV